MSGRATTRAAFSNPVLVGASIVIALIIGVFLSYNANRGLPFVKTFKLEADVPDAAELVVGSEVRIGGFRVGQVNAIEAIPPREDRPPFARLSLNLDGTIRGIPEDTVVRVRPRSLLGAKYVELEPGDGRDLETGGTLPLRNAEATPELDETFNVFDAETRRGLQGTIRAFGDATAGRGSDINRSIVAMDRLLPSLRRVSETLADPRTDLDGFVEGLAQAMAGLAPVAEDLGLLLDRAAVTLRAVEDAGPELELALDALPGTAVLATAVLRNATPVLRDFADVTVALREGTRRLPRTTARLTSALRTGTVALRRTRELTDPLDRTLRALDRIAADPRAPSAVRRLTRTVQLLEPTVEDLEAAQTRCNVGGTFAKNVPSVVSRGDRLGTWLAFAPILRTEQALKARTPDPLLHVTTQPDVYDGECEAGNEPYVPGTQVIGSPAGEQPARTEETAPPPEVTELARSAGLLRRVPGASR